MSCGFIVYESRPCKRNTSRHTCYKLFEHPVFDHSDQLATYLVEKVFLLSFDSPEQWEELLMNILRRTQEKATRYHTCWCKPEKRTRLLSRGVCSNKFSREQWLVYLWTKYIIETNARLDLHINDTLYIPSSTVVQGQPWLLTEFHP